ncbi:MAG: DUF4235 domain-containing protein [Nocardioidaceae bacterium]|nr:DUF4235 domain-containing protein [Nocardioidaceae bacterium]MCL2611822.1 DUF4235 domain-containing protein [Nocardioidaceae bacterium]
MGKKKSKAKSNDSSKVWSLMAVVSGVGGGIVAKKLLNVGWKAATGKQPPENPADPDVQVAEAVAWAVASGTVVALIKMLLQRRAANYYLKSTGELPPPLRKDEPAIKA